VLLARRRSRAAHQQTAHGVLLLHKNYTQGLGLEMHDPAPGVCGCADPKIGMLGAMQALFEGAMYTFVFLWTPALSPQGEHIPHGMIFACFMVSSMVGSAIAGRLLALKTCAGIHALDAGVGSAALRMARPCPTCRLCQQRLAADLVPDQRARVHLSLRQSLHGSKPISGTHDQREDIGTASEQDPTRCCSIRGAAFATVDPEWLPVRCAAGSARRSTCRPCSPSRR